MFCFLLQDPQSPHAEGILILNEMAFLLWTMQFRRQIWLPQVFFVYYAKHKINFICLLSYRFPFMDYFLEYNTSLMTWMKNSTSTMMFIWSKSHWDFLVYQFCGSDVFLFITFFANNLVTLFLCRNFIAELKNNINIKI